MQTVDTDVKQIDVDEAVAAIDGTDQPSEKEEEETEEVESSEEEQPTDAEEETVESLKAKLEKSEKDKENYKRGMLAAQTKGKKLPIEVEEGKNKGEEDEIERRVLKTLAKREQRLALTDVLDPSSKEFIPELTKNYYDIIEYLPANYERTSSASVKRALRVATAAWKYDHGVKEDKLNPKSDITDTGLGSGDSAIITKKPEPTLNIPEVVPMSEWFKSKKK